MSAWRHCGSIDRDSRMSRQMSWCLRDTSSFTLTDELSRAGSESGLLTTVRMSSSPSRATCTLSAQLAKRLLVRMRRTSLIESVVSVWHGSVLSLRARLRAPNAGSSRRRMDGVMFAAVRPIGSTWFARNVSSCGWSRLPKLQGGGSRPRTSLVTAMCVGTAERVARFGRMKNPVISRLTGSEAKSQAVRLGPTAP